MKSLYRRQFAMTVSLILISFALLGTAFIAITYQYSIREKRENMIRTARLLADYTAEYFESNLRSTLTFSENTISDRAYMNYVLSMAQLSGGHVLLANNDGTVAFVANGVQEQMAIAPSYMVPAEITSVVKGGESYIGTTDMGGIFPDVRLVAGHPVDLDGSSQRLRLGGIYVAAEASSLVEMWRGFVNIYFFTAIVVFCIASVTSSITSQRQTKPLKEIADAARKFGHGEYDTRVAGYETRRDEVGELAEAFNAMADAISRSEARRSEFVANISHELKTPMTTIAGFADGILDGTVPPEREREYLQTISAETRRLSRLVRQMLDLSRLQSRETVIAQEQFDVSEVMLRVLVSLEPKINGRHLDVDTDLPLEAVLVWGDPDAITQVCYNLLDNAIKFSSEGSTLGIRIAAKGGKAYVTVHNTGETIPAEELSMLFDRFHKSDKSRSMDREGVGLGLYIVKTILGSHKENITVTSENGVTEFTFTLTLA